MGITDDKDLNFTCHYLVYELVCLRSIYFIFADLAQIFVFLKRPNTVAALSPKQMYMMITPEIEYHCGYA